MLPEGLRQWRTRVWKLSQKELAAEATRHAPPGVRVSPSLIAMIETGDRQPSLETGRAIAAVGGQDFPLEAIAIVRVSSEAAA